MEKVIGNPGELHLIVSWMKQLKRGDLSLTNWHLSSVPAHFESTLPRTSQEPNHTMPTFLGFKVVHLCVCAEWTQQGQLWTRGGVGALTLYSHTVTLLIL